MQIEIAKRQKIVIGIDPGTKTGFAVKNLTTGEWLDVDTIKRWEIPVKVLEYAEKYEVYVVFEDATQRTWYGKDERQFYGKFRTNSMTKKDMSRYKGIKMGAGSVMGSSTMIREFLDDCRIPYVAQKPKSGATKVDKKFVARLGWEGRSSEHSRDAIMLIQGYNNRNLKLHFKAA